MILRKSRAFALASGLLALGCGSSTDGTQASTSGGQGGGSTSAGEGGGATTGATTSGGTGGSGAGPSGCAEDCSQIQPPPCMTSVCDEPSHECKMVPGEEDVPCDDGLFCTLDDICHSGVCVGGAPNTCGITNPCAVVNCSEQAMACGQTPLPNDAPCTSPDLCVINEKCMNGQCIGAAKDCFFAPVPDECHVGVCNPATGTCDPQPGNDGGDCPNDGDLCMVDKVCLAGVCQGGTPKDCSAFTNGCNNGVCNAVDGSCGAEAIPPGGMCVEAVDECNSGICDDFGNCLPVPLDGITCPSATDDCNTGYCQMGTCAPTPDNEGVDCNDGNSCTLGETCLVGVCQGGVMGGYVQYFSETFASNAAGWTLGTEWAIGPATASVGASYGSEDPSQDHTASQDNGVAGVVIGGHAQQVIHLPYYIESPVIDTNVMGPIYLEFWRMLNSDYTPYMNNMVEVYNGATWVKVWESGPAPGVQDPAWTKVSYDLTAYKNANMRIRFGFDIGSGGVFKVSSWNVDDVVIANQSCN